MVVRKNKFPVKLPDNEKDFDKWAYTLIDWAQQDSSLTINEFFIRRMITPKQFDELIVKSDILSKAYDLALCIIGTRRERLAQEGMLDRQIVRDTMPLYDPAYRKWLMSLKYKDNIPGETKVIVVEIPMAPNTGRVPPIRDK